LTDSDIAVNTIIGENIMESILQEIVY